MSLSPLQAFLVAADLSLVAPLTNTASLLRSASTLLDTFSKQAMHEVGSPPTGKGALLPTTTAAGGELPLSSNPFSDSVSAQTLTALSAYQQRLQLLSSCFPRSPLYALLQWGVPLPLDPAALSVALSQQSAERNVLSAVQTLAASAQRTQQQQTLHDAIEVLSRRVDPSVTPAHQPPHPLIQFLRYLLELSATLGETNISDALLDAPDLLLARLVFAARPQFDTAERVAKLMHCDLVAVVLRAALSAPDIFPLTDAVLHYVEAQNPFLASLSALLAQEGPERVIALTQYAVQRTSPESPFGRLVRQRQELLSLLPAVKDSLRETDGADAAAAAHTLLASESHLDEEVYVRAAVRASVTANELLKAVALSDTYLSAGADDDLLAAVVEESADRSCSFAYVRRMQSGQRAAQLALLHMREWSFAAARDTLESCLARTLDEESETDVRRSLRQLLLYERLRTVEACRWSRFVTLPPVCALTDSYLI